MIEKKEVLYEKIFNDIRSRISGGEFSIGDKLDSISQLCKHYNVSTVTIVRVIAELRETGIIRTVAGKGSFVCAVDMPDDGAPTLLDTQKLETIVMLVDGATQIRPKSFLGEISLGIMEEVNNSGLGFRKEFIRSVPNAGVMREPVKFNPGEAAIILSGEPDMRIMASIAEKNVDCVTVDSQISGYSCIMKDNFGGIEKIIDHFLELGHKNMIFAKNYGVFSNALNESELANAFSFIARVKGFKEQVIEGGDSETLLKTAQESKTTAILFGQDDPALRFISFLKEKGFKVPEDFAVSGFDHHAEWESGLDELTSFAINCREMGRKAVELLLEQNSNKLPDISRIPGKLLEGKSTIKI